jgi:hypothetical protein
MTGLVNDIADKAIQDDVCSDKDDKAHALKSGGGKDYYGRYLKLGPTFILLLVDYWAWARWYPTPIWIEICGDNWENGHKYKPTMAPLASLHPPRLFISDGNLPYVPILLLCGEEKDKVVRDAVDQLRAVKKLLTT